VARRRIRTVLFSGSMAVSLTAALYLTTPVAVQAGSVSAAASPSGDPAYSVPTHAMAAALSCPGGFTHPAHEPVLLVHGTASTPDENWGWNYALVLPQLGWDVCTVALPGRALGDIQVSAEYVVYAIRAMYAATGRTVEILGHSQGPLEPRWALKWWPSLRSQVDDVVMMAGPNHGTAIANAGLECTASCLQMKVGSKFLAALNAGGETPAGPSYTSIYSLTDELVQPEAPAPTAALSGASNILMQDVCPGRIVEHVQFASDAAVFAVVMDAFTHPGPADASRIDRSVCSQTYFPGVNPSTAFSITFNTWYQGWPPPAYSITEPPLKCYAGGPCP
jgi:triacylglycerol lipase